MDELVALPFHNVLGQDPAVEVTGSVARVGEVQVYLRAPVTVSSLVAVGAAASRVSLPGGSGRPAFAAAGPPARRDAALVIELDPDSLDHQGVTAADVRDALRTRSSPGAILHRPGPRGDPDIPAAGGETVPLQSLATFKPGSGACTSLPLWKRMPGFRWAVRLEARTLDALRAHLRDLCDAYPDAIGPAAGRVCIPRWRSVPEVEPIPSVVRRFGLRPPDVHRAARRASGRCRLVWEHHPVYIRLRATPPARWGKRPVRTPAGSLVPLGVLARFRLTEQPEPILRIGPRLFAGYLLLDRCPGKTVTDLFEGSDLVDMDVKQRRDLADSERALLGWPPVLASLP